MVGEAEHYVFQLTATNGHSRLVCVRDASSGAALFHRVRLEYQLPADSEPTAIVEFHAVRLERERLRHLFEAITTFVSRPLAEIDVNKMALAIDLAAEPSEALGITLGPRDDVITGSNGIGCLVELRRSSLTSRLVFRTDVTCLQLLADGLGAILGDSGG